MGLCESLSSHQPTFSVGLVRLMEADPQLFDECRKQSFTRGELAARGQVQGSISRFFCTGSANHKEAYDEEEQS